jgi:predicted ribosome quality control (RQC) complex YloA/Tae2 family protein
MHSAYHTIAAAAKSLPARLAGHCIEEAYSQDRDELILAFSGVSERLVISCRPDFHCCYLHRAVSRARRNSANVLPACVGQMLVGVEVHPGDRIVTLRLSNDDLVMQFFGARSNVILASHAGRIHDAFKRAKELVNHDLPPLPPKAEIPAAGIAAAIRTMSLSTVEQALRKLVPYYAAVAVKEIFARAEIPADAPVTKLDDSEYERLVGALTSVSRDLEAPAPRIYTEAVGMPPHFSLIPLMAFNRHKEQIYADIHEALHTFAAVSRSTETIVVQRRALEHRLHSMYNHARRTVEAIEKDLAVGDRADQYMKFGSLILQNLSAGSPGAMQMIVQSSDGEIPIPLNPTQTPSQNAQRFFQKAKASKHARVLAEKRRNEYISRMNRCAALLEEVQRITARQELKKFMEDHQQDLHGRSSDIPSDAQDQPLFKAFTVEGGFEVWAGKNSANNDLLTLRYAKPQDYWFHARGSSGSHVILRIGTGKGEPGKRALQQAASIAAYYSKMKTARLVPVAVTRRKYVHKPKGAAAGSVVLQREDVLMVEPILPQQSEDSDA